MTDAPLLPLELIARRYRVRGLLGTGAMASVYEVTDESTGATLALKRLLPERLAHKSTAAVLQREYDTLTQLSHPLIIRAFDYGLDEEVPYYTMERLAGQSVGELAPAPWKETASLVRDVASALALVHSRKLIHRDVSARNVCRTDDGRAKLLDFGALSPMGPVREIVGTPPYLCPESLELRPLDARADLFSLGALAYYLLTRRHAYPARRIAELGEAWLRPVEHPSAFVPDVPPSLDALVMALIDRNPLARPGSAAEVFDRLTAIASLPPVETPETAEAYFLTPNLVARGQVMRRFRRQLLRAERGRGSAVVVESRRGGGRSRLLASLLLDAKLRGTLAMSADANRGRPTPFGVVRALASSLRDLEPALAAQAVAEDAELGRILALGPGAEDEHGAGPDPESWISATERVTRFLVETSRRRPLVIGIDDVDVCDGPSAAVVTALADAAHSEAVLVLATTVSGSRAESTERLRDTGATLVLNPLGADETRELVSSVFGEVPHLDGVADWVHRLSDGLPRMALQLAQHLVDSGLARYSEGGWVLPSSFEGIELPASLDDALDARVRALGSSARRIAEALSLLSEHDPLAVTEYPALLEGRDRAELFTRLNELVSASVLVDEGPSYAFSNQAVRLAVRRGIANGALPALHRRIAHAYESSEDPVPSIAAHHLLKAGDPGAAFALLLRELRDQTNYFARGIIFLRTPEAAETVDTLFEWGRTHAVAAADMAIVSRGVLQLASIGDARIGRHGPVIIEALRRDSGLLAWDELSHIADPQERIQVCIASAYERYMAAGDRTQRLDPGAAIQHLATAAALLIGVYVRGAEDRKAAVLDQIMRPLAPISPALDVVSKLMSLAARALRSQYTRDLRVYVAEQTAGPVQGIDELSRVGIHLLSLFYLVLEDTTQGQRVDPERLAPLDGYAPYAPLAWQARMLCEYYRGDEKKGEACRKRRDAAITGRLDVDGHLDTSVLYEASTYATLGNLMALKRLLPVLEARATERPGWGGHYRLAAGNCHFLRGDHEKAIEEYERGLALHTDAARVLIVTRLIRSLVELGRGAEAKSRAEEALVQYRAEPLIPLYLDQLELSLAGAEAAVGEHDAALARARSALARADGRHDGGVVIVNLLVDCALIAKQGGDSVWFEVLTQRVGEIAARTESTALATQYSRLLSMQQSAKFEPANAAIGRSSPDSVYTVLRADVHTELQRCQGPRDRGNRALRFLVECSGAEGGFLYVCRRSGLECAAAIPEGEPGSRSTSG